MSGTESHADREEDYRFLHSMLMEKKLHLLFKIHERLRRFENRCPVPVQERAASLASDLARDLIYQGWRDEVKELVALLNKPLFKSLLSVHDTVAQRDFEPTLPPIPDGAPGEEEEEEEEDSVKFVSLVKTKEPLGATIRKDESTGAIVVARILRGGAADKSGLIHEGDELKEVNGVSLEHRKPKEILPLLARSQSEIKFKIVPAFCKKDAPSDKKKLFVRALFDYDPSQDPAVPCKDAAVAFKRGDILQVASVEDDAWWQARLLGGGGGGSARAGLIPSQQLHEKRVALQRPETLFRPRQEKPPVAEDVDYGAITGIHVAGFRRSFRLGKKGSLTREAARPGRWSAGLHGSVCPLAYVEVMPYRKRDGDRGRLVVLVDVTVRCDAMDFPEGIEMLDRETRAQEESEAGPGGVGVNELKRRLLISDPDRYGVAVPHTTRKRRKQEAEGVDYHFVSVHVFEEAILGHRFIEYGRHTGHYYGTSLDAVHRVLAEGKVCLLDVHPSKIQLVYAAEFQPYVVFVKPPRVEELRLSRRGAKFTGDGGDAASLRTFSDEDFEEMLFLAEAMENRYGHLFDRVIVNGDMAAAFAELKRDLERAEEEEEEEKEEEEEEGGGSTRWVPAEWVRSSERRSCGHLSSWI